MSAAGGVRELREGFGGRVQDCSAAATAHAARARPAPVLLSVTKHPKRFEATGHPTGRRPPWQHAIEIS